MRRPRASDPKWSEVTPRADYLNRRSLMLTGLAAAGLASVPIFGSARAQSRYSTSETPNSLEDITNYNNFYEFGLDKTDPARLAHRLTTSPWEVEIAGLVERPGRYSLEELIAGQEIEERIYRLRCVEAWSMVIPWQGFELGALIRQVGLREGAAFVAFETVYRPEEMPGAAWAGLDWPYREALRLDEALHPLTLLATGLYGEPLPNQNGAPIRLVVPWKYGFKSIKSIVRIEVTAEQPLTTWQQTNPREYGFYANVNPEVDHPRWSQASERRIGDGLFARRRPTEMFNGYGEEVAELYRGLDLARYY